MIILLHFWFPITNVGDKLTCYSVSFVMSLSPVCSCSSIFFQPGVDLGLVGPEAHTILGALFKKNK